MFKRFLTTICFLALSITTPLIAAQLNTVNTYVDLSTPSFNSVIPYDASGGRAAVFVIPVVNGSTTTYIVPYSSNGYIGIVNSPPINNYIYTSSIAWHTQSISLGAGTQCKNYSLLAVGGTVTYTLNGGSNIKILTGYTDEEEILPLKLINPTIAITEIGANTSAYIKITGSN